MKIKKQITWHKADYGTCWKGAFAEGEHFTIIQAKDGEYTLQVPRTISKGKGLENIPCETLIEAQELAAKYV